MVKGTSECGELYESSHLGDLYASSHCGERYESGCCGVRYDSLWKTVRAKSLWITIRVKVICDELCESSYRAILSGPHVDLLKKNLRRRNWVCRDEIPHEK